MYGDDAYVFNAEESEWMEAFYKITELQESIDSNMCRRGVCHCPLKQKVLFENSNLKLYNRTAQIDRSSYTWGDDVTYRKDYDIDGNEK